jgi:hypothetical protein
MPIVPFQQLPPEARVWIFAASDPLAPGEASRLLAEVDAFLGEWNAHGEALTCGRDWRDRRFVAIGVDQTAAGASGCSIDGLFRVLQRLQQALGTALIGGGRVFYREPDGDIRCVDRAAFASLAADGRVGSETPVFDTSVTTARAYRDAFERQAGESWHRELLARGPAVSSSGGSG